MEIKVSIIIPVLNSIKYIDECINSVLNQSLQEIEILMVDGGSTDGTLQKLYEYEKKDPRCKVLHSKLKSCGYQNNFGLKNAIGEYIAFVESDDVVLQSMYEELWNKAKKYDLDYVKGDFETFYYLQNNEKILEPLRSMPKDFYGNIINSFDYPQLLICDIYLWKGIYKRTFLIENAIWQNETPGAAFQDVGFAFQSISCGRRVMYVDKAYYHYRRDNQSSSVYNVNGYVFLKNEFLFLEHLFENKTDFSKFWPFFYRRLSDMVQTRDKVMVFSEEKWVDVLESLEQIGKIFWRGIKAGRVQEKDFGEQRYMEIIMLCKDPEFYLRSIVFKHTLKKEMWNTLLNQCQKHKHTILFGCSITNRRLFAVLERNGIVVDAFCDNEEEKWGTKSCGIPVLQPEAVLKQYEDAVFLIPKKYERAMCDQLTGLGVQIQQMIVNDIGLDIATAFVYHYNKKKSYL